MIDTSKYEGHTPADEWRLVFSKGAWTTSGFHHKQMDGFSVKVYDLRQMQVCDPEDYLVAQANQDLAKDAPLLLQEVKRLREENERYRRLNNYLWEHRSSHWSADNDAEMDRLEMIE